MNNVFRKKIVPGTFDMKLQKFDLKTKYSVTPEI